MWRAIISSLRLTGPWRRPGRERSLPTDRQTSGNLCTCHKALYITNIMCKYLQPMSISPSAVEVSVKITALLSDSWP